MPERNFIISGRTVARWMLLLSLGLLVAPLYAEQADPATSTTPSAEAIQTLVKELGHDDFQKRVAAQKALADAGIAARPALEAALNHADAEVRNTARALLDKIKWTVLPAQIDYTTLFPAESLMMFHLPGIGGSVKDSKATAVVRLWDSEPFKPLRAFLDKKIKETAQPGAKDGMAVFKEWAQRFEGQVAAGLINFQMGFGAVMEGFVIAEITDKDAAAVFQQFLTETQVFLPGAGERFEGLHIRTGLQGQGAVTLAGKHLIIAPTVEGVKNVARGLLKPAAGNLRDSALFKKVKAQSGSRCDLLFFINMEAYLKIMAGMGLPPDLFKDSGYDQMQAVAISTAIDGDVFEDRIVVATKEGEAKGIVQIMNAAQAADPKRPFAASLAVAPPNAVMAASSYLDGTATMKFAKEYFAFLNKTQTAVGGAPDPTLDFAKHLQNIEAVTGLKTDDIAAHLKGDMVMWVSLKEELAPPDVGMALPCPDAAKATELASKLVPLFSAAARHGLEQAAKNKLEATDDEVVVVTHEEVPEPAEQTEGEPENPDDQQAAEDEKPKPDAPTVAADAVFFSQVEKAGHMLFVEAEASPLMKVPERMMLPYRLCWAAHGERVIVSSSVPGLLHRLKALDAKTPGLDAQKLAGPSLTIDGNLSGLTIVDLAQLLNYASKHGLPLAAAQMGHEPEVQKLAQDLAAQPELFKNLPPILMANHMPKDGIVTALIRGPAPYVPSVLGVAAVSLFMVQTSGKAAGPGPVVVPPAPGP